VAGERPPRLYLVAPDEGGPEDIAGAVAAALGEVAVACVRLELGARAAEEEWVRAANHLLPVCHEAEVPLLVAEHYRLVAPLGLDGVHVADPRVPLRTVRRALGADRIVGAFAGASRHAGMTLAEAGADYVALGPVGDTGALGGAERAGDDLFQWWAEMIETPCVAEGAVSPEDVRRLEPYADFVVPDRRLWAEPEPLARLRAFAEALGG
jgi:thiamine-phosphate pyrophosphorylase